MMGFGILMMFLLFGLPILGLIGVAVAITWVLSKSRK